MSSNSRDKIICGKILDEISEIHDYTSDVDFDGFMANSMMKKAVIMSFINIGELANSLSDGFRKENTDLPLRQMIAVRNIAAHKYGAINFNTIWDTIKKDLLDLRRELGKHV